MPNSEPNLKMKIDSAGLCLRAVLHLDFNKPPPGTGVSMTRQAEGTRAGVTGLRLLGDVGSVSAGASEVTMQLFCRPRLTSPSTKPYCASLALKRDKKTKKQNKKKPLGTIKANFYLRKFPPPISLLYLLVRWSACSVSLDRTPNSPLRWKWNWCSRSEFSS